MIITELIEAHHIPLIVRHAFISPKEQQLAEAPGQVSSVRIRHSHMGSTLNDASESIVLHRLGKMNLISDTLFRASVA
jgi:hypothetical protein